MEDKVIAEKPPRVLYLEKVHSRRWQGLQLNRNTIRPQSSHLRGNPSSVHNHSRSVTDMPGAQNHCLLLISESRKALPSDLRMKGAPGPESRLGMVVVIVDAMSSRKCSHKRSRYRRLEELLPADGAALPARGKVGCSVICLLYTSDAADE